MATKFHVTKVFQQKLLMPLMVACFILFAINGYSQQGVSINTAGIPAHSSAMLDVSSTSKGLLIPRVALSSINDVTTISSPATSLMVYNTNAAMVGGAVGFWFFNGSVWVQALGPQGIQGPVGATGAQGIQGVQGPVGATGAAGAVGPMGPTGPMGVTGPSGAANAWQLTGNAGTIDGINFIGTTDYKPFNIRVANEKAGRIDPSTSCTFYGYQAGNVNTASNNTAIGNQSLRVNSTGESNTAMGWGSLWSNTTGYWNTAVGWGSMFNNVDGYWNTATGFDALNGNTSGSHNSGFGLDAISGNTTGNYNSALGYAAYQSGTFSYSTAIGSITAITGDQMVRVGWNALSIGGPVGWSIVSDKRFKVNVNESVPGLAFINKLRPVTYHMDMDAYAKFLKLPDSLRIKECEITQEAMLRTGFIAQEVEKVAQELGFDFSGVDKPKNDNDFYSLRYDEFVVPLVKAVQELDNSLNVNVESLKLENQALKAQLSSLQKEIEEIKLQLGLDKKK